KKAEVLAQNIEEKEIRSKVESRFGTNFASLLGKVDSPIHIMNNILEVVAEEIKENRKISVITEFENTRTFKAIDEIKQDEFLLPLI
ncbi:14948_t:CDS:2, partial [Gigaspora margarita]